MATSETTGPAAAELLVLGETQLTVDGEAVGLSPGKAAVLASLALNASAVLGAADLAELIWEEPPANLRKAVQNQVRRIRSHHGEELIETVGRGYRLGDHVNVDADRVESIDGDVIDIDDIHDLLLAWRGQPFAELVATPEVWSKRERLNSIRATLLERLADDVATRRDPERLAALALVRDLPLSTRERIVSLQHELAAGGRSTSDPVALSDAQSDVVEAMLDRLARARVESGAAALFLSGEAGSGKSTVLRALTQRVPIDVLLLTGECSEAPASAHEVPSQLLADLPDEAIVDAGLGIIEQVVASIESSGHETVVVIDDLQWATPAVIDLVDRLAALGSVTVVLASRRGDLLEHLGSSWKVEAFASPALDLAAVTSLLERVLPEEGSDLDYAGLGDEVLQITRGHALLTKELVHELAAARAFVVADGGWRLRRDHVIPTTLAQAVTQRVAGLALASRLMIERLAIFHLVGGSATSHFVMDQPLGVIDAVAETGLVEQVEDRLVMHIEVARAVVDGLAPGAQAEHHGAASSLLSEHAPIAAARHIVLSGGHRTAQGLDVLVGAAWHASGLDDWTTAVEMWDTVIEVARSLDASEDRLIDYSIDRTDAARLAGDPRQLDLMRELIELVEPSGDVERTGRAALAVCSFGASSDLGPNPEFQRFAELALSMQLDPRMRCALLAETTHLYALSGNTDLVVGRFEEALRAAEQIGDTDLLIEVLNTTFMAIVDPNDLGRRNELGLRLLGTATRHGDSRAAWEAHQIVQSCALVRGDAKLMDHHIRTGANLRVAKIDPSKRWSTSFMASSQAHLQGRLAEAEALADECLVHGQAMGPERAFSVYGALLVPIRLDQGRIDELIPILDTLRAEQPDTRAWVCVRACAAAEMGELTLAEELLRDLALDRYASVARDSTYTAALYLAASAAADVGDAKLGRIVYDALAPLTGRMSWTGVSSLGPVDLVLGQLGHMWGDRSLAAEHFATAAELVQAWPIMGLRVEIAQAALQRSSPEVDVALRAAFARATQLGASGVAVRARRLLGG